MKKLLFASVGVLLVAAGCTSQQSAYVSPNNPGNPAAPSSTAVAKNHYANTQLGVAMDIPANWQVDTRVVQTNSVAFKNPNDPIELGGFSVNPINADLAAVESSAIKNKNNDISGLQEITIDGLPALSYQQTVPAPKVGKNQIQTGPTLLKAAITVYNSKLYSFTGDLTSAAILSSVKIAR